MQCAIIRSNSPGRWITHNFMGFFNEFDHWPVGANLDLASWDSYPIGFVERFPFSEEERNLWARTSHPDIAPFHHDLYRGVGHGRFWVMEQQPGPVNWAAWNPVPKRGMVRLWTWEALAHGAEVVSYFRWRQAIPAQEQFHSGLNLPGQHEYSQGGREAAATARELDILGPLPTAERAPVAIVYDYSAHWMTRIQPQGADFRFHELAFRWYEAVRRLGLDVDFVAPGADLTGYSLVLVPTMPHVSDDAERAFAAASGTIIYGPRSGSRTRHHAIPANLPPGPLGSLLGMRVLEVSSLRPGLSSTVQGTIAGKAVRWREYVETDSNVLARFDSSEPALICKGNHHYLACWPDEHLLSELMGFAVRKTGLRSIPLPPATRTRQRGNLTFAFNYGTEIWESPIAGQLLIGRQAVEPQDLSIWRVE